MGAQKMNDLNSDKIDRLEGQLISDGVSINEMSAAFSMYLLSCLDGGRVKIDGKYADAIRESLGFSANIGIVNASNEKKKSYRLKMAEIEISLRRVDPVTSAVARCAGDCLYGELDWQQNNDGDDTPLFYYLYHLERVIPSVADDFFAFFCGCFGIMNIG